MRSHSRNISRNRGSSPSLPFSIKNIDKEEVELLDKTVQTFAEIKNVNIKTNANEDGMSSVGYNGATQSYSISVDNLDDGLNKITKVEHEIGHILWNTSVKKLERTTKRITKGTPQPQEEFAIPEYQEKCDKMVKGIYNLFEDVRCESNTGKIYAGSKKQFEKQVEVYHNVNRPIAKDAKSEDPFVALFCARFNHDDANEGTDFEISKEYLKQVEGTDEEGSILLTKMYWDDVVIPWLQKQIDEQKKQPEAPEPPKSPEGEGDLEKSGKGESGKDAGDKDGKGSGKSEEEFLSDFKTKSKDERKKEIEKMKASIEKKETSLKETKAETELKKSISKKIEGMFEKVDDQGEAGHERTKYADHSTDEVDLEGDLESKVTKAKDNFEKQFEEIRYKLTAHKEEVKIPLEPLKDHQVVKIERRRQTPKPDLALARHLNKLFTRIKAKYTDTIEIAGNEVDIDEYIQAKIKGSGEFWVDDLEDSGMSIVIGIDLSGSMGEQRIQVCRDLCSTLYKALNKIDGVDLTVVAWSSPNEQYKLTVTEIKNEKDCAKITSNSAHCQNANHMAHQYCDDLLRRAKSHKRLVIMMTDGEPVMYTGARDYTHQTLIDLTKQAIKQTRRHGTNVFGIYVGDYSESITKMKGMYGSDFVSVPTIEEARTAILKSFEANVVNQMRSV